MITERDLSKLSPVEKLKAIMSALRNPDGGCPWDIEQTFDTIAPYTIEEAYEVADAIQRKQYDELKDELGDLLFQVAFHSQIASEDGLFDFEDVAEAISQKMITRHPHVFGDAEHRDAEAQMVAWEEMKAAERRSKASKKQSTSAIADVALALPALMRAQKLQKRAARVGFDWPDEAPIFDKIEEELTEVKSAIANKDPANLEEELGDLLFVCVNLARKLGFDAEEALRAANQKFSQRFIDMETLANSDGKAFSDLSLDEQEILWQRVKSKT
jgi:ATP diphosphatase